MNQLPQKTFSLRRLTYGVIIILLVVAVIYEYVEIVRLKKDVNLLTEEVSSATTALSSNFFHLSQNLTDLRNQTLGISNTLTSTQQNIDDVKSQVGGVAQTVGSISGAVGDLQKLSQVDAELLKKYSKVYFMNENYKPAHLTEIPAEYTYSTNRQELFLSEAWPALKRMLDAAKADGIAIYVRSGYRSFGEQKSLKTAYSIVYSAGKANAFSADQGYSEHQLGTTLDFITTGLGGKLEGFDTTTSYQWLTNNAHRFGFVLSYPKGNSYYIYEPWHWRFVGVTFATFLHNNNLRFYDLDQRDIDKYLLTMFD